MPISNGWVKLHRAILEDLVWTTATAEQKAVLFTVLLLVNHKASQWLWKGEKFEVQPGQLVTSLSTLADNAGVSVQNVRSALRRFEKLGFITNESTKSGRLITVVNWGIYQGCGGETNKGSNKEATNAQHLTRSKEGKNKITVVGFDEFWQVCPRKVGKQNALKAWQRINPDDDLRATILAALERQAALEQWKKDGGKYIPHPATWLNGRRWEDEVDESVDVDDLFAGNGMRVY